MKTQNKISSILSFPLVIMMSLHGHSQIGEFFRGHVSNDTYIYCTAAQNNPILFYLTENGSKIEMKNKADFLYGNLKAETIPGIIFGHTDSWFGKSEDYGKDFQFCAPYINDYTTIQGVYGGEIPGAYIAVAYNAGAWPYPGFMIYKTFDYGLHFTLVADTMTEIFYGEIGMVSGELYQMSKSNGHAFLERSINYGATFDTLAVDTTIINENLGIKINTLSRGSQQGELFLVSQQNVSSTEVHYNIYHTSDYGHTWILKSSKVFDSDWQQFTAGRDACSFYISNLKPTPGSSYYTLQIYYSADCGETFTVYEHHLTPDVGLADRVPTSDEPISISPNPASDEATVTAYLAKSSSIEITVYNSLGKCVVRTSPQWQAAGLLEKKMDIGELPSGVYSVKLSIGDKKTAIGKLMIVR